MLVPWCPVPIAPRRVSVTPPAPVPALHGSGGCSGLVSGSPRLFSEHFTPLSPHTSNAAGSRVSPVLGAAARGQPGARVGWWVTSALLLDCHPPYRLPGCGSRPWKRFHPLCASSHRRFVRSPARRLVCRVPYGEPRRWEARGEEQQPQLGRGGSVWGKIENWSTV